MLRNCLRKFAEFWHFLQMFGKFPRDPKNHKIRICSVFLDFSENPLQADLEHHNAIKTDRARCRSGEPCGPAEAERVRGDRATTKRLSGSSAGICGGRRPLAREMRDRGALAGLPAGAYPA